MPISVIYFYLRRPDVTPEHFRSYMEETHVPLIKEVFEMHPPQSLRLRYIARVKTGAGDRLGAVTSSRGRADPDAPVVLVGSPKDVDWDAIGEMVFRDELHVQQCLAVMNGPGGRGNHCDNGEDPGNTYGRGEQFYVNCKGVHVRS
jgi:hypothetical protein